MLALKEWLANLSVQTQFIESGSPLEKGYYESFNGKLRDKLLDGEMFMMFRKRKWVSKAGASTTPP